MLYRFRACVNSSNKSLGAPYQRLWDIASKKIKSASEISLIGLSLNDFDHEALKLIGEIRGNKHKPFLSIIDYSAFERFAKVKELAQVERNHFSNVVLFKSFEDFLEDKQLI